MKSKLKRKSFFVDEGELKRLRHELGAATDSEAVREAIREMGRMRSLWRFMQKAGGTLPPGSFSEP